MRKDTFYPNFTINYINSDILLLEGQGKGVKSIKAVSCNLNS